ncbi:MAG: biotin/lipoyl-binding protein [Janthinobacterium lividum]
MKTCPCLPVLVLTGFLLIAGCGHKASPDKSSASDTAAAAPVVQVATAKLGTIEQTLPATGTLTALRTQEVTITPPVAGILDALSVHFGQMVQKGQVVAQLSTRSLLGQIQQAQATIAQNQV